MNLIKEQLHSLLGDSAWVSEIFLVVLITLLLSFVWRRFSVKLHQRIAKTKNFWDDALIVGLLRPMTWAIWVSGIAFAIEVSQSTYLIELIQIQVGSGEQVNLRDVLLIGLFGWFLTRFIHESENRLVIHQEGKSKDDKIDQTTIFAMGRLLRVSVTITVTLVTLQTVGVSIGAVLAFGGVGGIAVGFAAKDLLANFFGGLMIYLDRPFAVGDWIRSPDRNIEGTVEYIGWRQTRIRTFDKRPLYVPNAIFNSIAVENPSRMTNRRIYETIGIRYQDLAAMSQVVEDVKAMLSDHNEIAQDQTMIVNFDAFSESSVDFFIYTFTKTTDWIHFHEIKQDVLLKVAAIIDSHGGEMAFPSKSIYLENIDLTESANPALSFASNRSTSDSNGSKE